MSFLQIQHNGTGLIIPVFLQDSNGAGVAGVLNTAVTARYKRQNGTSVAISTVNGAQGEGVYSGTATEGAWAAAANMAAGNYEFHVPNNAIAAATGVGYVILEIAATGCRTERFLIEIGPFELTLPNGIELLAIDANGRVDVGLIEGVDATTQIAANSSSSLTAAAIADAVWDELRAGHTNAGSFGEGVASVQGGVTGAVGSVTGNVGGNVVGSVGSVTGAVTITGTPSVNATQIAGSATAASNLSASAQKIVVGTVTSATTTTMVAAIGVTGSLLNATVVFSNGLRAKITSYSYAGGNGTFGFAALSSAPTAGMAFAVV